MKEKLKRIYRESTLSAKIRYSYLILLVPIVIFVAFCIYNLWDINHKHADMLNSVVIASEFSLDFKKDFDYETYLLIVENKSIEESKMQAMIEEAKRIVDGLEEFTDSEDNKSRLISLKKYIDNLEVYKKRIEDNIIEGNMYETNIEIWENDVQIVTSLFRETIVEYIYYETKDIQQARTEYEKVFANMITYSVIAFVCFAMICIAISYFIPQSITKPIRRLSEITDQVAKGNLDVRSDVRSGAEVSVLNDSLNAMIDKINDLVEQVKTEQVRLRKAEFELLQAQINPHFLYNTLDAIVWLAEAGEQKKVVSMVESLSGFFRSSLNHGKDIVTIKEETCHVRSYLEIQQVRYQDILQYQIDIPDEFDKYLIPKITIQPLVENALYHGIKNKRGVGKISITGKIEGEDFVIIIQDNGIGMTQERLNKVCDRIHNKVPSENEIYGLYNVNERIRLNFGEQYGISITSEYMEGTVVKISLPCIEKI